MFKRAAPLHRRPRIDFDTPKLLADHSQHGRLKAFREPLSRDGIAFLAQMAGKASLAHTAESFPHVINKLAPHGYRPSEMIRAIDRLLIDDRPERQGFPFEVVVELGRLRETYMRFLSAARQVLAQTMQSSDEKIDLELSGGRQYDRWEQETILPLTSVLLESIPFDLYPYSTERDFPHVLNVLARHWSDRAAFIEAAGSLLHVQDGPRQGFPRLVFFEILGLVAYHGSLPDLGQLDLRHLNLDLTDSVQQRLLE